MKIPFFIGLFCAFHSLAQTTEVSVEETTKPKLTLAERGLNRFFVDGALGAGFMRDGSQYYPQNEYGIITNFRIGNNFYLGKGNNPMILRLTWFRIGVVGDIKSLISVFPHFVTPQLGLIKHFKVNETASIEHGVNVGYIFATEFPFDGIGPFGVGATYELKFNVRRFCFGAEYGIRIDTKHSNKSKFDQYHYVGLLFGVRFGRGFD